VKKFLLYSVCVAAGLALILLMTFTKVKTETVPTSVENLCQSIESQFDTLTTYGKPFVSYETRDNSCTGKTVTYKTGIVLNIIPGLVVAATGIYFYSKQARKNMR